MEIRKRNLTGTKSPEVRTYEIENRKTARKAAAEGMVLLKNENNLLPIEKSRRIALYGAGAVVTIKGGMGSGDVNSRECVSIYQGLVNAGYTITTEKWIHDYEQEYDKARLKWRQEIWDKEDTYPEGERLSFFKAYSSTPFQIPAGEMPDQTKTDMAIFVLSRNAGEGKDRLYQEGDYFITEKEEAILAEICRLYPHVLLALNIGGIMDLNFADKYQEIEAILYVQQPGMEGGNAVADVISGTVTPSGKMTDTWAVNYEDYPSSKTFSHNDGDVDHEEYKEGIYVGYRYFDTYDVPVRYDFGYGLSYTTFDISDICISQNNFGTENAKIVVKARVSNTGNQYSGKEVVQVYICPPQEKIHKEYKKLVGFNKTGLLAPGEAENMEIDFPASLLSSFHEEKGEWMIEKGTYGIFVGNSLSSSTFSASICVTEDLITAKTEHVCIPKEEIIVLDGNVDNSNRKREAWLGQMAQKPSLHINLGDMVCEEYSYSPAYEDMPEKVRKFVDTLTQEQLIMLATGNIGKGQGAVIGSAGINVPGSAAETSDCASLQGIAPIVLADGPAGLRLNKTYQVKDGEILPNPHGMAMEDGFLCRESIKSEGDTYYQFCTAFPVGTLLAQSWDVSLLEKCGAAVAEEMEEFNVTLWLAPGMNIHRNPLCGRNFEYYSEDPVVSGCMAAAITKGVQSKKGYGTTIKHFACNSQEDNRMGSDSVLGERTLREIYLKGFEIAIKESNPMSVMTSYNLVNGIHAANHYDLCTKILRNEWNYKGLVMTDWTTTMQGDGCTAAGCMRAGNDIVMPGCAKDHENIRQELANGSLDIRELKRSVARLVNIVWQSDRYVDE